MTEKENVITKIYDLLLYLIPQLAKFPRDQKFILADRIEIVLLDLLEMTIEAYYTREKVGILTKVNLKLEKLRFLIRLSHDLKYFSHRRYGFISEKIEEIGRMVGGWKKTVLERI